MLAPIWHYKMLPQTTQKNLPQNIDDVFTTFRALSRCRATQKGLNFAPRITPSAYFSHAARKHTHTRRFPVARVWWNSIFSSLYIFSGALCVAFVYMLAAGIIWICFSVQKRASRFKRVYSKHTFVGIAHMTHSPSRHVLEHENFCQICSAIQQLRYLPLPISAPLDLYIYIWHMVRHAGTLCVYLGIAVMWRRKN